MCNILTFPNGFINKKGFFHPEMEKTLYYHA